jgi:iron(III) transport system substrate-binding protein
MTNIGNYTFSRRAFLVAAQLTAVLIAGTAYAQNAGGPAWDTIVAAAKKEGAVTIYANYDPNQIPKIKAAFEKSYPEIKVEILRLATAAAQQRIEAEAKSGTGIADVIGSADIAYQKQHTRDGRFAVLVGPDVNSPAVGDWLMGEKTFVMNYFVYYGYGWNTQMISGKPSLKDLLSNPAYRGRVGVVDFTSSTTFAVSLDGVAKSYVRMYGETEADFYAKLKALQPRYYPTVVPIIQAIGAGELAFSPSIAPGFIDPKMPVGSGDLDRPPAGANYVAIPGGAPHPNAAQVYANWCLTVAGQTVLAEGQASVLPNIPTAALSASKLLFTDTSAYTTAEMEALVTRQRQALGR